MDITQDFKEIEIIHSLLTRENTKEQLILRLEHLNRMKELLLKLGLLTTEVQKGILKAREDLKIIRRDDGTN